MQIVDCEDRELVREHIVLSFVLLGCPDRDVSLLPQDGILPGSSMVVRVWVQSFVPVVNKLVSAFKQFNAYSHCTEVISPSGRRVDVGFSALRRRDTSVLVLTQGCLREKCFR